MITLIMSQPSSLWESPPRRSSASSNWSSSLAEDSQAVLSTIDESIPVLEAPLLTSTPEHTEAEMAYRLQQNRAWTTVLHLLKPRLYSGKKRISPQQEEAALDMLVTFSHEAAGDDRIDSRCSYTVEAAPQVPQFHHGYSTAFFRAMQFKLPNLVYYLCTAFEDADLYLQQHAIGDLEACAKFSSNAERAIFKTLLKALPVDKLRHLDLNQLLDTVSQAGVVESLDLLLQDSRIPWSQIVKDEALEYRPFHGSKMTMEQLTRVELVQNVLEHCPTYLKTLFKNKAIFSGPGAFYDVLKEFQLEPESSPWAKYGKPFIIKIINNRNKKSSREDAQTQSRKRQRILRTDKLT